MFVDYDAVARVLGPEVEQRFGEACEGFGDGYDAPGLLAMAFEAWQADQTRPIGDHMNDLLDRLDAYNAE